MQRRVPQGEQEFEQLVHALPTDWEDMMRELGAFTYAGKIQSHEGLLRALLLYGGPDQSLREVAGVLTLHAPSASRIKRSGNVYIDVRRFSKRCSPGCSPWMHLP